MNFNVYVYKYLMGILRKIKVNEYQNYGIDKYSSLSVKRMNFLLTQHYVLMQMNFKWTRFAMPTTFGWQNQNQMFKHIVE